MLEYLRFELVSKTTSSKRLPCGEWVDALRRDAGRDAVGSVAMHEGGSSSRLPLSCDRLNAVRHMSADEVVFLIDDVGHDHAAGSTTTAAGLRVYQR